uniref:Uncharacterized protein n=2 Tax=Ciona intestinalis TaxID=7719 RepID=H2XZ41_CIOIN
MSGSASATCLGNALWSEVPPSCTDINECRQNSDSCHDDAECRNNIGSYTCTCREGFNGDGFNCEPNECFIPNTPAYASIVSQTRTRYIATNTITYECNGGYGMVGEDTITCQSDGSWSADPPTCEDNDECTQNTPCDPNASCDNTPGSYTCSCNERYTGDGETCTEIQCGSLSNPTSGTVTIPSQTVGGTATYLCN